MSSPATQPRRRVILGVMLLTLAVVFLTTVWLGMNVLLLTFAAICFAILLDSLAGVVMRYIRVSRGKALALVVLSMLAISVGVVWLMAPSIARQFDDLATTLPEQSRKLEAKLMEYRWGRMLLGEGFTAQNDVGGEGDTGDADAAKGASDKPGSSSSKRNRSGQSSRESRASGAEQESQTMRVEASDRQVGSEGEPTTSPTTHPTSQPGEKLAKSVQAAAEPMVRKAGHWASGLINVAVMLVVVLVAGIYMAIDPKLYIEGALHLVPKPRRQRIREMFNAMAYTLRWWLIGQGITMVAIGVLTGLGLWLIGVRLWLTFAILAALFNFIPNFGPLIAFIPAIVFALADPDGVTKVAWITGLFVVAQSFEGYVLTPMVQKKAVDTAPALLILFQVMSAYLFGSLGLMLAAPLLAALVVAVKMLYVQDVLGDDVAVEGTQSGS